MGVFLCRFLCKFWAVFCLIFGAIFCVSLFLSILVPFFVAFFVPFFCRVFVCRFLVYFLHSIPPGALPRVVTLSPVNHERNNFFLLPSSNYLFFIANKKIYDFLVLTEKK